MAGVIEVLAAGAGHNEVTLNTDPKEAKKQIDDFVSKRYALFVSIEGQDHKVHHFDEATNEIVVETVEVVTPEVPAVPAVTKTVEKRVSALQAKVTAVAPTAGG